MLGAGHIVRLERHAEVGRGEGREQFEPGCSERERRRSGVPASCPQPWAREKPVEIPVVAGHLCRDRDKRLTITVEALAGGAGVVEQSVDGQRPPADDDAGSVEGPRRANVRLDGFTRHQRSPVRDASAEAAR